jgi:putative tryptophan/tyrosine transport system substrate-binding protein
MTACIGRRDFITLLGGAAAGWPMAARAQQAGKTYKIGYLNAGSEPLATKSLFDALSELGWIEGKNLAFERRWAENRLERLPELAAELVRLNVSVIVAFGTLAPLAAKRAEATATAAQDTAPRQPRKIRPKPKPPNQPGNRRKTPA